MLADTRHALRQLRLRPGFAAIALLTLALGIGANTAIFSAARAALFQPLPFDDEETLVRIYLTPETGGPQISLRPEVFVAVQERAQAFESMVAQRFTSYTLMTESGPERVVGIAVSENWGSTLGVRPLLGRLFSGEEEQLGEQAGVVLLSHGSWQRRFAGERSVVGRQLDLNGTRHTVIGVMPPGFAYPYDTELWVPMQVRGPAAGVWSFNVPARLKPGWTVEQAGQDLRAVAEGLRAELADIQPGMTLIGVPLREVFVGEEGRTLIALLAAVGLLLLIVCANLTNLLLARALGRRREFALRAAVGASRARLLRLALVESLVLAVLGGTAGVAIAFYGSSLVQPLLPGRLSFVGAQPELSGSVLAFSTAVALASGMLCGLLPALWLTRDTPLAALGSGGPRLAGSRRARWAQQGLVVGELALALSLLAGIGLMVRDLERLSSADLGYTPEGLTTFTVSLGRESYGEASSRAAFAEAALVELGRIAGVVRAGGTTMFPASRSGSLAEIAVEGRESTPAEHILVNHRVVTAGFLEALGVTLLRGRLIEAGDRADTPPVAVVSAALADRFWPGRDPVGERVRDLRAGEPARWLTIVGVVSDVKEFHRVAETWYLAYAQHADDRLASRIDFSLRSAGPAPPDAAIRRAINAVDPKLPIFDVVGAWELYAASFERKEQAALLGSLFAGFALLLAALGVYGSISYAVQQRTREIGVRMALGSDRLRVLRNITAEGGRLVAAGLVLGLAGALALSRLMASALTEIGSFDPVTLVGSALVLAAAGSAATLVPAWRATTIDPVKALRQD